MLSKHSTVPDVRLRLQLQYIDVIPEVEAAVVVDEQVHRAPQLLRAHKLSGLNWVAPWPHRAAVRRLTITVKDAGPAHGVYLPCDLRFLKEGTDTDAGMNRDVIIGRVQELPLVVGRGEHAGPDVLDGR